jgi:hypothetical protein
MKFIRAHDQAGYAATYDLVRELERVTLWDCARAVAGLYVGMWLVEYSRVGRCCANATQEFEVGSDACPTSQNGAIVLDLPWHENRALAVPCNGGWRIACILRDVVRDDEFDEAARARALRRVQFDTVEDEFEVAWP